MSRAVTLLLLCAIVAVTPGSAVAANAGASELRGYVAVNRLVRERLFLPGSTFELGTYIGQEYDPMAGNLLDLLGTYKTGFGVAGFRNGKPNPLNMLLWHMLFSALASDVARVCAAEGPPPPFNPAFTKKVLPLCGGPVASDELREYWMVLIGRDAPLAEYELWEQFATAPELHGLSGAEYVESLTLAALGNPYFLLRR